MQAYSSSKKKTADESMRREWNAHCVLWKQAHIHHVHRTYQFQFKKTTHMCMYMRNGNGVWCMGQAKGNKEDEKTRIHKNWYFNVDKVKNMPIEHCMITLLTATVATVQHHTITTRVTAKEKKSYIIFRWFNVVMKRYVYDTEIREEKHKINIVLLKFFVVHIQFDSWCSSMCGRVESAGVVYSLSVFFFLFFCYYYYSCIFFLLLFAFQLLAFVYYSRKTFMFVYRNERNKCTERKHFYAYALVYHECVIGFRIQFWSLKLSQVNRIALYNALASVLLHFKHQQIEPNIKFLLLHSCVWGMLGYHTVHLIALHCIETIELKLFETPTPLHILTKYEHFLINRQRQHLHCLFFSFK